MIIKASNKEAAPAPGYDHRPIVEAALKSPGDWFTDDAEDFPTISPVQIRRGAMKLYRPAGAWTARKIKGRVYVCFLGVPKKPWAAAGDRPFSEVKRTLEPDELPEGTPRHVVRALIKRAEKTARKRQKKIDAASLPDSLRG